MVRRMRQYLLAENYRFEQVSASHQHKVPQIMEQDGIHLAFSILIWVIHGGNTQPAFRKLGSGIPLVHQKLPKRI